MDLIFREDDFQTDYTNLAMLCETFPNVPVVALTATASKKDIKVIKQSLNLNNPLEVIGNPNHPNIFYRKVFRKGDDMEFFEKLLEPRACDLKEKKVNYSTTVMDLPLCWCGFAFKYFKKQLADEHCYPYKCRSKARKQAICTIPCSSNSGNKRADSERTFNICIESIGNNCYCCNGSGFGYPSRKTCYSCGTTLHEGNISKKLGIQDVMENSLIQHYTTTIETLPRIVKDFVMTLANIAAQRTIV